MKLYLQKPRKSHEPRPFATALRMLFVVPVFEVPVFPAAIVVATLAAIFAAPVPVRADILTASDGAAMDRFGGSVHLSGDNVLVGAWGGGTNSGSAYYYKGLNGKSGTVNETVKLLASDGVAEDWFGWSVSLSGDSALVGAFYDDDKGSNSGSAYYYKGLNGEEKNGTVEQDVKLFASDGAANDNFGYSVSLSGDSALVGADFGFGKETHSGAAYYYKGLNGKSGTVEQEDVKLIASDGESYDNFGYSVSLSGDSALVGMYFDDDRGSDSGSAYYYKGLNEKNGTVEQDVKLLASDGAEGDFFGQSVSLSGDNALVGALYDDDKGSNSGSAYYYKGLNAVNSNTTELELPDGQNATCETVKLLASDGAENDNFGRSVSLSTDSALVGADRDGDKGNWSGSAYYYKGLNGEEKNGTVTQDVKLLASDGAANAFFGQSVSLSGDRFVIGAQYACTGVDGTSVVTGKAYAGDIRAFTTLDAVGGAALATGGLSFVSQGDWIIGETTRGNQVTLSKVWSFNQTNPDGAWFKDTADVTADGKAVYVGQHAGADNNTLLIEGTLTANAVYVGAADNSGNTLHMAVGGRVNATTGAALVELAAGNTIVFDLGVAEGESSGTADTRTGLVAATRLTFGGTLELTAGDGFEAVIGNEYKLFDFVTGESLGAGAGTGDTGGTGRFDAVNAFPLGENLYWDYSLLYSEGIVRIAGIDPGTAVPEPSAWAAIAGMVLLAWTALRRRRRHHA
jgi:hypothetical protein